MAEWLALRPILDICARETGYERGGKLRVPRWKQAAEDKQLKVMVEEILVAAKVRRQQESIRCGKSK